MKKRRSETNPAVSGTGVWKALLLAGIFSLVIIGPVKGLAANGPGRTDAPHQDTPHITAFQVGFPDAAADMMASANVQFSSFYNACSSASGACVQEEWSTGAGWHLRKMQILPPGLQGTFSMLFPQDEQLLRLKGGLFGEIKAGEGWDLRGTSFDMYWDGEESYRYRNLR